MGDKITRPTVSVDHMRARFLRESLHNGAAALSASDSGASVVAESAVSSSTLKVLNCKKLTWNNWWSARRKPSAF